MRLNSAILFLYLFLAFSSVHRTEAAVPYVTISWDAVTLDTTGNPEADTIWYWIHAETFPDFTPGPENFIAATLNTSYEHFDARHSDPNVHFYYVVFAVDLWGNKSPISVRAGKTSYVLANIKVFLEGPFNRSISEMITTLKAKNLVPLSSPYSSLAPRTVTSMASNIVDWVLLEIRHDPEGPAIARQSFFLRKDGRVVETDGSTINIGIPGADSGSYYLVMRHRIHLAVMSADPVILSTSVQPLYDFSTNSTQCYGTQSCVNMQGSGVWGMWTGDVDGSGTIGDTDVTAVWNDRNKTGYRNSDCGLDAIVNAIDRSLVYNNRNKATAVP